MITAEDIEHFREEMGVYPKPKRSLNGLSDLCHKASYSNGWWHDPDTGEEYPTTGFLGAHVIAAKIGLIHSEISEAMEGHRKGLMDDKLPHRKAFEVELVDALIRIFDIAGQQGMDLDGAFDEKMDFNDVRPDHKVKTRKAGGKLY